MTSEICHVPSCRHNAVNGGILCGECRNVLAALLAVRRVNLTPQVACRCVASFRELQYYSLWKRAADASDDTTAHRIIEKFWGKIPSLGDASDVRQVDEETILVWGCADGGDGRAYTRAENAQWKCDNMLTSTDVAGKLETLYSRITGKEL